MSISQQPIRAGRPRPALIPYYVGGLVLAAGLVLAFSAFDRIGERPLRRSSRVKRISISWLAGMRRIWPLKDA